MAAGQSSQVNLLEEKTLARIKALDEHLSGTLGIAALDLNTGRMLSYHGDTVFPQASSIKIPILVELFRAAKTGEVQLDTQITLSPEDAVGGSGWLISALRRGKLQLSVNELATAMIEHSDNTATNKLIALLGRQHINDNMVQMGFRYTKLQRIMLDSAAAGADRENVSTPLEMASLVEAIYRGKAVDPASSGKMIEILKLVDADFRRTIPTGTEVAAKAGSLTGVKCETGIVFLKGRPFILSVMSSFLEASSNPVPAATQVVWEHFEKLAASNSFGNRIR